MRGWVTFNPALRSSSDSIRIPFTGGLARVPSPGSREGLECIIGALPTAPDERHSMSNRLLRLALAATLIATVGGCGILYKQPIYQGNLMEKSAVEQLQVGMGKQQVSALIGSPSIADPFHQQRWDYTSTQRAGRGANAEIKTFTLYFENDALVRWEGEYFPEQDQALAAQMRKFGNLPKEKKGNARR